MMNPLYTVQCFTGKSRVGFFTELGLHGCKALGLIPSTEKKERKREGGREREPKGQSLLTIFHKSWHLFGRERWVGDTHHTAKKASYTSPLS